MVLINPDILPSSQFFRNCLLIVLISIRLWAPFRLVFEMLILIWSRVAMILRKVWTSVFSWPGPSMSSSCSCSDSLSRWNMSELSEFEELPSMGNFDRIPTEIFSHILRFLSPKDVAKLRLVCRAWRLLSSDNHLWIFFLKNRTKSWESIVFAETNLRASSPLKIYHESMHQLSFMQIYARREVVPGSIIVDGGSGYCKYGWSKYDAPSGRCATFLEFGNIESPMYARLHHFFSTVYSRMQVKASSQPIILSLPLCHYDDTESARASRKQYKEAVYSVLFDMNVPAVCVVDQAVLALYAARRTSGILVNIGFNATTVVPIYRGRVMREIGVEMVGQGAFKLTDFLKQQMQRRNIQFGSLYTVRTLKEKLCYVAIDYDSELRKNTEASWEIPGEGWFTLSKERFQTAEILFQPQMGGMRATSLHHAVSHCMHRCVESELISEDNWFKTVVLAGGTSCLPGLAERLEKELRQLFSSPLADGIKVVPPPYGTDSAWYGAKMISNVSTFPEAWCVTKKQLRHKFRRTASLLTFRAEPHM